MYAASAVRDYRVFKNYREQAVLLGSFQSIEEAREFIKNHNDHTQTGVHWISYPKVYADNDILPALAVV